MISYLYRQNQFRCCWDGPNQSIKNIVQIYNKSRQKTIEGKDKKEILMKVHMLFMKVEN